MTLLQVSSEGFLVLVCVETRHSGTYHFTASNAAGEVDGEVEVEVVREDEEEEDEDETAMETCRIVVEEFGQHVAQLHNSGNKGFAQQFQVLAQ